MASLSYSLWLIHMAALCGLAVYGIHRIWLLYLWRRIALGEPVPLEIPIIRIVINLFRLKHTEHGHGTPCPDGSSGHSYDTLDRTFPRVTIQLPLYNERFVAERLLRAVAAMDWPTECIDIQVLDDSTDSTRAIVDDCADDLKKQGLPIRVIRRENRDGFKAGALSHGLTQARGEFVAVFDADFIPDRDFLLKTVPRFTHKNIGMVQCRWAFVNEAYSWLTRIQGLLLSSHFRIEHRVRHHYGMCFNFNGTAGIWRKNALIDAGGWQPDTVTEDLDISYRAQLKGWRFVYVDDYAVLSELPATLDAFRNQQKRWTKGSIQTARKLFPRIIRSKALSPLAKMEAAAHLLSNLGWLLCLVMTLTLYPAVTMNEAVIPPVFLNLSIGLFFFSSGAVLLYFLAFTLTHKPSSARVLPLIPVLSIGMAPVLALSVLSGLITRGGTFVRTPKYGLAGRTRLSGLRSIYRGHSLIPLLINLPIFVYTLFPVWFLWQSGQWTVIFPLLFPVGFLWIMAKDLWDSLSANLSKGISTAS